MAGRDARRAATVATLQEAAGPLHFVDGGRTGSLERTSAEATVTEVAAGSGLSGPSRFDHDGHFALRPVALFALSVVRRPAPRIATLLGAGYVASGPGPGPPVPVPVLPLVEDDAVPSRQGEGRTIV